MGGKGLPEQRVHQRFQAKEGAFAVLRNHQSHLGQIIDISKGGLAIKYISAMQGSDDLVELDIFMMEEGFHSERIPFRTVSDLEMEKEHPLSSIPLRRVGVAFRELSSEQQAALEHFIHYHTQE